MSKKCYRFFGGLLNTQEKWLNKMSEKGYRLVRTGKLLYEFEKCKPDEVTYCVEFIGEKSKESSIDYANFLEDMGYKVFFKNINLNYNLWYFCVGFCNSWQYISNTDNENPEGSQDTGMVRK